MPLFHHDLKYQPMPKGFPNDAQSRAGAAYENVTRADLWIYQGDSFARYVDVYEGDAVLADLTGYTPRAQIRRDDADRASVVAEFAAVVTDAAAGEISISLLPVETEALSGKYVWDMQLVSDADANVVTTILGGAV